MKILKTYLYPQFAYLDLAKLKEDGIEAFIKDENIVAIDPLYAQAVGGIKLVVNDEDYRSALEIINANDYENLKNEFSEEEIEELRICKKCGSTNIFRRSSWLTGLFFLIFFFIPVAKKTSKYYCLDCENEWEE